MAKHDDDRFRRGLCVAVGCLLTFAMPAAAGAGTPAFLTTYAEQSAPQPAPQQQGSATPATNSGQADTGQPATIQPSPAKADVKEEPNQQTGGLSADAQESFRAQIRELQEQLEELNVRAKTAKTGLIAIKSDMASQGLGLRSDVLEAAQKPFNEIDGVPGHLHILFRANRIAACNLPLRFADEIVHARFRLGWPAPLACLLPSSFPLARSVLSYSDGSIADAAGADFVRA